MRKSFASVFAIIILALVSSLIGNTSPTHAQSFNPRAEAGRWENVDPNTYSITRVNIDAECPYVPASSADEVESTYCPYPRAYYVQIFAKCSTFRECDWGRISAIYDSNGWLRATYDQGFALKRVWMRVYEDNGQERLRVYIWTDYTDEDGREDFSTDEWFQRT
ncbi:MAG: hypothetical protein AAGF95_08640 [Chloroflexota bacterium]